MFQGSSDAATASSSAVTASVQSDTVPATTRSRSSSVGVRRGQGGGRSGKGYLDYLENTLHTTHTSDTDADAECVQNRKTQRLANTRTLRL